MDNGLFRGFKNREVELSKIKRYNLQRFAPMFYRADYLLHSKRVYFILNDLVPFIEQTYKGNFNIEKALILSLVHNDTEIITKIDKVNAIEKLSKKFPKKIKGFKYKDLLYNALNKDTVEAQLVSYCDKVDAYCECLHEIHAGNKLFVNLALTYIHTISSFSKKFPNLRKILASCDSLLLPPKKRKECELNRIAENSKFHGVEDLRNKTDFSHYNGWKHVTMRFLGSQYLVNVKES